MPDLHESDLNDDTDSTLIAGAVVLSLQYLRAKGIKAPAIAPTLAALSVSRSHAYVLSERMGAHLPMLCSESGRPSDSGSSSVEVDLRYAVACATRDYLIQHPGAMAGRDHRSTYSQEFTHMVIDLRDGVGATLSLPAFAEACGVPLETLRQWLRPERREESFDDHKAQNSQPAASLPDQELPSGVASQVIGLWRSNPRIALTTFRDLLHNEHRIDLSLYTLRRILRLGEGKNRSKPRRPRPDPEAIRGQLQRFFPGAQWMADGKNVALSLSGEVFAFNWELVVDTATGASVGIDVSDVEDSTSLGVAFDAGVTTTTQAPMALLTDNLPANHSEQSRAHLEGHGTLEMPSTAFRPENKATVEGAFGLFAQQSAPLVIDASEPREIARQVISLILTAYCTARNFVPRRGLGGKNAAQVHQDVTPTEREKADALAALQQIKARISNKNQRELERTDPEARRAIEDAFNEFGMRDPEGYFLRAIAKTGIDAVLEAVAIFRAKSRRGQSFEYPERYFYGIARNLAEKRDQLAIYEDLLALRINSRDRLLAPLVESDAQLQRTLPEEAYASDLIGRTLGCDAYVDRAFWRRRFLDVLSTLPDNDRKRLARTAARKSACAFNLDARERQAFTAAIAAITIPFAA